MRRIPAPALRAQAAFARQASRLGPIARNSIAAFAIYVAGAATTYGAQLVIARLVGPEGYGTYAYVFSWMTIFAYAAALGFDVSMLRFVSAYRAQEAWSLLRGIIRYAERRVAVAGAAVIVLGAALLWARAGAGEPALRLTFLAGLGLVPVWALLWVRCSLVRACGGVIAGLVPDRLVRDGLLIILLGVATFGLHWRIEAPAAMLATLLSSAIGLVLASTVARQRRPRALQGVAAEYAARVWRRSALPLVAVGIAEVAMNRTGVVLLGWSGDTRAAGIYALAFNFALVVALPRTAVNAWLAPTISALYARGDRAALQRVVARAAGWTLAGAVGLTLPLVLLAGPLLAWFGRDFGAGTATLRILLVGQAIAAGAGSQMFLLTMTGHEHPAAVMLGLAAGLNAVLSVWLIARFGPAGAALAATVSLLVWNVMMALFIRRRIGLMPGVLAAMPLLPLAGPRDVAP
jgi:O-antigen/teichoic acid export membrane protein